MSEAEPTVLIVRGAGPAGRRIATAVRSAGGTVVVMDERTCAHEGVHAMRVAFEDVAEPRRAVQDLVTRYGNLAVLVLLPPPGPSGPGTLDRSWEVDLGHEVTLVAGRVRAAAPALATNAGSVVLVSTPPAASHEPTDLGYLVADSYLPAIYALSDAFGFRSAHIATEASGAARDAAVAATVVEEVGSATPTRGERAWRAGEHVGASR